jgi:hypothetical protein
LATVAVYDFVDYCVEVSAVYSGQDFRQNDIDSLLIPFLEACLVHRREADRFGGNPWNAVHSDALIEEPGLDFYRVEQVFFCGKEGLILIYGGK